MFQDRFHKHRPSPYICSLHFSLLQKNVFVFVKSYAFSLFLKPAFDKPSPSSSKSFLKNMEEHKAQNWALWQPIQRFSSAWWGTPDEWVTFWSFLCILLIVMSSSSYTICSLIRTLRVLCQMLCWNQDVLCLPYCHNVLRKLVRLDLFSANPDWHLAIATLFSSLYWLISLWATREL